MAADAATLRDPLAVAEAIAEWAASRFDGPVAVVEASMLTGGFDNFVHAFRLDGVTLPPECHFATTETTKRATRSAPDTG